MESMSPDSETDLTQFRAPLLSELFGKKRPAFVEWTISQDQAEIPPLISAFFVQLKKLLWVTNLF